jgi:hypothetical protein
MRADVIDLALAGRRQEAEVLLRRSAPQLDAVASKFLSLVVDTASRLGEVFIGGDGSAELLHVVVARDEKSENVSIGTCAFLLHPGEGDKPKSLLEARSEGALALILAYAQWRSGAPVVARVKDSSFDVLRLKVGEASPVPLSMSSLSAAGRQEAKVLVPA